LGSGVAFGKLSVEAAQQIIMDEPLRKQLNATKDSRPQTSYNQELQNLREEAGAVTIYARDPLAAAGLLTGSAVIFLKV